MTILKTHDDLHISMSFAHTILFSSQVLNAPFKLRCFFYFSLTLTFQQSYFISYSLIILNKALFG